MKSRIIQDQPDRSNRPAPEAPGGQPRRPTRRATLLAVVLATVMAGALLLVWWVTS
jgi:ferric-dicitrate binding protein FerR (iron transport regulator)